MTEEHRTGYARTDHNCRINQKLYIYETGCLIDCMLQPMKEEIREVLPVQGARYATRLLSHVG